MRALVAILASTVWISVNEFLRNEIVLTTFWNEHYASLGLSFPSAPINGAVWGIWSLCYAIGVFVITRRFGMLHAALLAWWMAFVLMWLVTGNMAVLPFEVLPMAIPWSMIESLGAVWLIQKIAPQKVHGGKS